MRPFHLVRDEDETGISGTGVVAQGVEFTDGTVVMKWMTEVNSVSFYEMGIPAVEKIHGHGGKTRVVFLDLSDVISNVSVGLAGGGHQRLTWRELAEHNDVNYKRAEKWHALVADLDRCKHGRHSSDECSMCGGMSEGNPHLQPGAILGFDISGRVYVVPAKEDRYDIEAWGPHEKDAVLAAPPGARIPVEPRTSAPPEDPT